MDSQEYWKNREHRQLRYNVVEETEYRRHIGEIYDYMMDQIQKEINGFYTKYADKEGITLSETKKRVSKLDIEEYGRKAAKYVKDKDFSDEANEEMRLYNATMKINRLEMLKASIGLELVDGFNDLQKYFNQILTKRTLNEFERQAGILGDAVLDNKNAAHAIVNASFHNARFSDRIWMYQDMMKAELSKLLQTGLIQGRHPRVLAKHLSKLFGVRKSDAERLMQTELARVQTEAQRQSFERNGYDRYEFIAPESACSICKMLDGKHFGTKDMLPGENAPPMHPNCRCSIAAYMDREEVEKWISGMKDVYHDNYRDITKEWKKDAFPNSHKVVDLLEYIKDGVKYVVDGKHVLLDYSQKEKEIAELLERKLGGEMFMVPRILKPQKISTPDYIFRGEDFDLKELFGESKNLIYNAIAKKKRQANNFILDFSGCPLNEDEIYRQIDNIYWSRHTKFVDKLIIIKNENILKILSRTKNKEE